MKLNISSRDNGTYDVTDEHGDRVPLRAVTMRAGDPRVIAEVMVDAIDVHGAEVSQWVGLEQVPADALHAELTRRGQVHP